MSDCADWSSIGSFRYLVYRASNHSFMLIDTYFLSVFIGNSGTILLSFEIWPVAIRHRQ